MIEPKEKFMREAIKEARIAKNAGDYAVGAVIVDGGGRIISQASNRSKRDESPIAHAETLAIIRASEKLGTRHLLDCILYSTHEPCPMCAAVAVWARLKGIVYGAVISDMANYRNNHLDQQNYLWRTIDISCQEILDKSTGKLELVKEFMRDECVKLFHC